MKLRDADPSPKSRKVVRALSRQLCAGCVVAAALLAIETMIGGVQMKLAVWIGRANLFDVGRGNIWVLFAEVVHDRAPRRFRELILDLPAVIRHGAGHRQFAGGEIGERAAPAIANHRHASRVFDHVDRRIEVDESLLLRNLHPVSATFLNFLVAVSELDAAANAIEQTRRDGHVAGGGETIGDGPDVPVDAEDFLRDHHRTACLHHSAPRARH